MTTIEPNVFLWAGWGQVILWLLGAFVAIQLAEYLLKKIGLIKSK
jgi:hypothetical protein